MNGYLIVVAILAGVGIFLAIRVLPRRAPTADALLGQRTTASGNAPKMASDLRGLIQLNIQEKATGVLKVSSGGQTCSIFFLFGHVFHASCGSVTGEDAIRMAMHWPTPDHTFNPKAKLPVEETITRPIDEILNAA